MCRANRSGRHASGATSRPSHREPVAAQMDSQPPAMPEDSACARGRPRGRNTGHPLRVLSRSAACLWRHAAYLLFAACFLGLGLADAGAVPLRVAIFGDYGDDNSSESAVANLVNGLTPDIVVTVGDNSYDATSIDLNIGKYYARYIGNYSGSYPPGATINRFFPCLGNHDYSDGGGVSTYLNYFTLPGAQIPSTNTSGNERYYDYVQGPIHFFALNSNSQESSGVDSASVQAQWLKARLQPP